MKNLWSRRRPLGDDLDDPPGASQRQSARWAGERVEPTLGERGVRADAGAAGGLVSSRRHSSDEAIFA